VRQFFDTLLDQWYILIIGIVVIVTMAVVASYDPQPSAATVQQTAIAAPKTPPPTEAQHTQAAAASTSTLSTSASNQGRAAAPHDHTATAPQQTVAVTSQPSRQTAQTSATNIAENFSAVTMAQNTQTVAAPAAGSAVAGDAATGKQVFRKCQACHSMEPGKNLLGPSLAGVINRKAGEFRPHPFWHKRLPYLRSLIGVLPPPALEATRGCNGPISARGCGLRVTAWHAAIS
jgi:nitrite reductase (NO-forming)